MSQIEAQKSAGIFLPDINALMSVDVSGASIQDALEHVGALIDASFYAGAADGTTRALALLEEIEQRASPPSAAEQALIHYQRANAWENRANEASAKQSWDWQRADTQNQLLELRRAVRHVGFVDLDPIRKCQILTNLGGQLSTIGRPIEAIEAWDRAIGIEPRFAMALGNRGIGLRAYAFALYDPGHQHVLLHAAWETLARAVAPEAVYESFDGEERQQYFMEERDGLSAFSVDADISALLNEGSIGESELERAYRSWCLSERLFINPLNDLGAHTIAGADVLTLPDIRDKTLSPSPPSIIGLFNQMKQEFVSARFSFFEGLNQKPGHYSDRDVLLYNTLDYPAHGLGTERIRMAYRAAYSIFDKIGWFLNAYLGLKMPENQVSFRSVWHEPKGSKPLRPCFASYENWSMRGLYWLSRDFFEDEFKDTTEPDAEALAALRNHLEHKYLQLHEMGDASSFAGGAYPGLKLSLAREDFETKTLRVLKCARAALIYLSLAIHREEALRDSERKDAVALPIALTAWDDEWKT